MSVTIRYTEGLLLLPMGIVVLFVLWETYGAVLSVVGVLASVSMLTRSLHPTLQRPSNPFSNPSSSSHPWAIPVGALLLVNKAYFDSWTGYDPTHERHGFFHGLISSKTGTRCCAQFYVTGLMFVFPLAVIGLVVWFRHDWRRATVMAAWAVPCVFIYTVYYWAPDTLAIGYSRFFLTAFPAIAVAGAIAMRAFDHVHVSYQTLARIGAVTCVVGLIAGRAGQQDRRWMGSETRRDRWRRRRGDPRRGVVRPSTRP